MPRIPRNDPHKDKIAVKEAKNWVSQLYDGRQTLIHR